MIISLALNGCVGIGSSSIDGDEYGKPEPENNVVTKREWDLCCRICMKGRKLKGLYYLADKDVLQCRCADGIRAEIYRPDDD